MRTKVALTTCFLIFIFLAINHIAFGGNVAGVAGKTAPPSAEVNPARGILQPSPDATVIKFDDVSAPCLFIDTTALKNKYAALGVIFMGTGGSKNGGAILNECGNFDVTGHSSPNFLAFNANAPMSDGGIPKYPEIMLFLKPISSVQINAGSGFGNTGKVFMLAFGPSIAVDDVINKDLKKLQSLKGLVGFDVIDNSSRLQTLAVQGKGIGLVIIAAQLSYPALVLDDLAFTPGAEAAPSKRQNEKLTTTWGAIKSGS
jgi:hypothetical protein